MPHPFSASELVHIIWELKQGDMSSQKPLKMKENVYIAQAIETESHFLLNCELYTSQREELLNTVIIIIPDIIILANDEKFITLMSNQDPVVTNALANIFIYNCLNKQSNTVLMSNISQST